MSHRATLPVLFAILSVLALFAGAHAATTCTFTFAGTTMTLDADCTTDTMIVVPNGFVLDGNGYVITAVDPPNGTFVGGVVRNGGPTAHVTRLTVTTSGLRRACHPAAPLDKRLRGIWFVGASGTITHNDVLNINQGGSGCQEGNAIEVRNLGNAPGFVRVEIAHNNVEAYQKTGIAVIGTVNADVHHNSVGASATQAFLAANAIQVSFGATAVVVHNTVAGNQWLGASNYGATAILILGAGAVDVSRNNVRGNSDVGIYVIADGGTYDNNRVFDDGIDGPHGDWGIVNFGTENVFTNNKVRGFDSPYWDVPTGDQKRNKVIRQPHAHD